MSMQGEPRDLDKKRLELALDNEMADFGRNVIPWCIQHMRVFVHPFQGYWEDVGTIPADVLGSINAVGGGH